MGKLFEIKTEQAMAGAERRQYAALPFRKASDVQILLITSRETKRWVIPKGWPMKGKKPYDAAAQEAYEEAGIIGKVSKRPLGSYVYWKAMKDSTFIPCDVAVFPFHVKQQQSAWPEMHERELQWFAPKEAAVAVFEPGLKMLIEQFADSVRSGGEEPHGAAAAEFAGGDMAISNNHIGFLLNQMKAAGHVQARPMFGAAAFYCDEKVVALADEDALFVKPTDAGRAFIGAVSEVPPYEGAKPFFRLTAEQYEDGAWLGRLIRTTADALPAPKPRKPRPAKKPKV